ncbi:MAG: hypothetical protein M5R38_04245 [Candidatus Methylomirabilis sp.]|nr:hypothetical protein [Candidatus Methylomirabilis sp.]
MASALARSTTGEQHARSCRCQIGPHLRSRDRDETSATPRSSRLREAATALSTSDTATSTAGFVRIRQRQPARSDRRGPCQRKPAASTARRAEKATAQFSVHVIGRESPHRECRTFDHLSHAVAQARSPHSLGVDVTASIRPHGRKQEIRAVIMAKPPVSAGERSVGRQAHGGTASRINEQQTHSPQG